MFVRFRDQRDGRLVAGRNLVQARPVVARTDGNQAERHFRRGDFLLGIKSVEHFVDGPVAAQHQQFAESFQNGFPRQFDGMVGVVRNLFRKLYTPGF